MKKLFVSNILAYGGADLVLKFIAFAVFPIYAHLFTVAEFGILELIGTIAGLIGIFLNIGLNNAVQRFYFDPQTSEDDRPTLVSTGLLYLVIWSSILSTIVIAIAFIFKDVIYLRYQIPFILLVIALLTNVPSQILQYSLDTIRLHFAPVRFSIISVLKNITGMILSLVLIIGLGLGLVGYYLGSLIALSLAIPVGLWAIKKDLVLSFDRNIGRTLVLFGYPFIFAGVAYWIFASADRIMLVEFSDLTQVGLYSIAFKFTTILTFVNAAFGQAWSPLSIKIYQEDENYREIYSKLLSIWMYFLTIIGIGLGLFAQELLIVTTPQEYWPAATVIAILAIGMVMLGTTQITVIGISLEKKTHLLSYATWITAGVNVLLNYLLIPQWGANGAAFATLLSYLLLSTMYIYWTQRLHPIPLDMKQLCISLFLCMAAIPFIIYLNQLHSILVVGLKSSVLILLILLGFKLQLIPGDFVEIFKSIVYDTIAKKRSIQILHWR